MLEKIKNKWNTMLTHSLVFMGLAEIFNQNKKMIEESEKIKSNQEEIISILEEKAVESREDVISKE